VVKPKELGIGDFPGAQAGAEGTTPSPRRSEDASTKRAVYTIRELLLNQTPTSWFA
jgi:hypothetical protein